MSRAIRWCGCAVTGRAGINSFRKRMAKRAKESTSPLRALTEQIAQQEATLREGGGAAGLARQRKLGRLPARERIELLIDKKSHFLEIGLWAAFGMYEEVGGAVSAGVVTGIGNIHDRACIILAKRASAKAGAVFPPPVKQV